MFGILLVLYSLILYPILRADRYYNDDLKRAQVGRAGWDSNGRPPTTLPMRMLQSYDHAMLDISPLPQIGAIAILAWVDVLLARRYSIASSWMAALAAFPRGAQPFHLEILSFKFFALSMSVAMLLAVLLIRQLCHDRRACGLACRLFSGVFASISRRSMPTWCSCWSVTAHYPICVSGDTALVRWSAPGESPWCVDGKGAEQAGRTALNTGCRRLLAVFGERRRPSQ